MTHERVKVSVVSVANTHLTTHTRAHTDTHRHTHTHTHTQSSPVVSVVERLIGGLCVFVPVCFFVGDAAFVFSESRAHLHR